MQRAAAGASYESAAGAIRTAVAKTAAPHRKIRRVRTRSQPAEEAGSRPNRGLVLCTSSFSVAPPSKGDREAHLQRKRPGDRQPTVSNVNMRPTAEPCQGRRAVHFG